MVSKSSKKISKGKSTHISSPITRVDATSKWATIRPHGTTVVVDHRKHALPALHSGKHIIPKPKGAAGKVSAGGYSLQDAMGLKGNKGHYNGYMHEIRIIVNSTLERKKTFRQQPPSLINEVVLEIFAHSDTKVQIKFPFFQQFADGWLIRNVLKCMLLNQKHDAKYQLNNSWNKDCHNEEGNEPDDEDNLDIEPESEGDVNHALVPVKKAPKKITRKTTLKKTASAIPDDQDDFDFEPKSEEGVDDTPVSVKKAPKKITRKTTQKKTATTIPDDQDDFNFEPESEEGVNDTPASVKKAPKKITKKKPADIIAIEKKAVMKVPITNPKSKGSRACPKSSDMKAASSLLAKEPPKGNKYVSQNADNSSDDEFNELISAEVQHTGVEASENIPAKFKRKLATQESEDELDITEQQTTSPSGQTNGNVDVSVQDRATGLFKCPRDGCFENLPTNISSRLQELLDARQAHLTADAIDFKLIPPRMKVLEGEVQHLLISSDAKESCYVFNLFSGNLIAEKKFGMNCKQAFDSFSKHKNFKMTAPQLLLDVARPGYYGPKGYTVIQACIQHLVDLTTTSMTAFQPLTLQQYTHFILIPFIALRLIMEDLKSEDEMDTYEYMTGSGDVGDMLQGIDDQGHNHDIYDIIMAVACKQPAVDCSIKSSLHRRPSVPQFSLHPDPPSFQVVTTILLHLPLPSGLEHPQSCLGFVLNATTPDRQHNIKSHSNFLPPSYCGLSAH
ncbi:uncharacterized protein EDB91DRAFT_1086372 [Suillus paluster]|uniref:uncharacterized protein n=1 Tax=Suillus paluster TaxID=48578 RepID=UPI001B8840EF|nr:uncharacterized protein EDB91DRAFT_1086372 [Suillus paluster]KAG1727571.1 hypothetical protein EDB91DRAFT_1086372 [Suillus paluster]